MTETPTTKTIQFSAPSGRERKPRSTSAAKSKAEQSSDVTTALTVMKSFYNLFAMGLTVTGTPGAAELLAESVDDLQAQNKQAFEASPKLASMIASVGAVSGVGIFVTAHVMTMGPVLIVARKERAERKVEKENERASTDAV